jgi:hypothetical protein
MLYSTYALGSLRLAYTENVILKAVSRECSLLKSHKRGVKAVALWFDSLQAIYVSSPCLTVEPRQINSNSLCLCLLNCSNT